MTAEALAPMVGRRVAIRTANAAVSGTLVEVTDLAACVDSRFGFPKRWVPLAKEYSA